VAVSSTNNSIFVILTAPYCALAVTPCRPATRVVKIANQNFKKNTEIYKSLTYPGYAILSTLPATKSGIVHVALVPVPESSVHGCPPIATCSPCNFDPMIVIISPAEETFDGDTLVIVGV